MQKISIIELFECNMLGIVKGISENTAIVLKSVVNINSTKNNEKEPLDIQIVKVNNADLKNNICVNIVLTKGFIVFNADLDKKYINIVLKHNIKNGLIEKFSKYFIENYEPKRNKIGHYELNKSNKPTSVKKKTSKKSTKKKTSKKSTKKKSRKKSSKG